MTITRRKLPIENFKKIEFDVNPTKRKPRVNKEKANAQIVPKTISFVLSLEKYKDL